MLPKTRKGFVLFCATVFVIGTFGTALSSCAGLVGRAVASTATAADVPVSHREALHRFRAEGYRAGLTRWDTDPRTRPECYRYSRYTFLCAGLGFIGRTGHCIEGRVWAGGRHHNTLYSRIKECAR